MYYVYLLQSKRTKKFYVGYTSDLRRRLSEHANGEVKSTRMSLPYDLVYYEAFKNRKDAMRRERKLKHHGQGLRRLKERLMDSMIH